MWWRCSSTILEWDVVVDFFLLSVTWSVNSGMNLCCDMDQEPCLNACVCVCVVTNKIFHTV